MGRIKLRPRRYELGTIHNSLETADLSVRSMDGCAIAGWWPSPETFADRARCPSCGVPAVGHDGSWEVCGISRSPRQRRCWSSLVAGGAAAGSGARCTPVQSMSTRRAVGRPYRLESVIGIRVDEKRFLNAEHARLGPLPRRRGHELSDRCRGTRKSRSRWLERASRLQRSGGIRCPTTHRRPWCCEWVRRPRFTPPRLGG